MKLSYELLFGQRGEEAEKKERKIKAEEKAEAALSVELPAPCNLLWDREEESGGGEYPAGREHWRAEAIHSRTHMQTHTRALLQIHA